MDMVPLLLTFKLALITTGILLFVGVPLAAWLVFGASRWRRWIEPLVSMPLVLPPTVLGFYLLLMLGPHSGIGRWLEATCHVRLVFTFSGLVVGSVVFSLPFMVNPVKAGFQNFPRDLLESAYTLGKSRLRTLWRVVLPNIRPAIYSGMVMAFAHTIGEFGVVLMIGRNIPRETRVASVAIYNEVEALNYAAAHWYSGVLFILCFGILYLFYAVSGRREGVIG